MSAMVERVAEALSQQYSIPGGWSDMARAAITAMTKPTDAMIEQMQVECIIRYEPAEQYLRRDQIVDIWERGVLEALK